MRRSVRAVLGLAGCLFCAGCAATPPPPDPVAELEVATRPAPALSPAPACTPVEASGVVTRLPLDADRELVVVGQRVRTVEAGGEYEVLEAQLLLNGGGCERSRVAIGELSRAVVDPEPAPTKLKAIGETGGNFFSLERGTVEGLDVILVFAPLDQRWGLTEYHLVPITLRGNTLKVGERIQSGRDAMGGDVYFGRATITEGHLEILRESVRGSLPPLVLRARAGVLELVR